jgi:subtilisin family serine protease
VPKPAPTTLSQYVILPTRGLHAAPPTSSPSLAAFLRQFEDVRTFTAAKSFATSARMDIPSNFRVLDSVSEDGAKLVEMTAAAANEILAHQPGLRIVPVVYYYPAWVFRQVESRLKAAATAVKTVITLQSKADQSPVPGAMVVAFTDFANRIGAQGTTNKQGVVRLALGGIDKIERLYVYPATAFWGMVRKNVSTTVPIVYQLEPIDLSYTDGLRHFYGQSSDDAGSGVTVGVVDTGIGPHPDLVVDGGENTVVGEDQTAFEDNGEGHGTHVGGIIAARGRPPSGIRGLAPAVKLRSYRVFGKGAGGASNYAIAKAIDRAVTDGCDLINLSLGGGPSDPATASAIHAARQSGVLVVAATGNEDRASVDFPGSDPMCIAVTALGRKGTFPKGSFSEDAVAPPFGTDAANFIGAFANIGPEVNLTAPGVGIISTVPGGYVVMDGTSMASPAAVGIAARLLAGRPEVLRLPRDQARSDAIAAALLQSASKLGFPAQMEGNGLPQP